MIVLVDTNILLDVLQKRHPHDAPATRVWKLSEERSITGYVSAISFNNVFYVARKQVGREKALEAVKLIHSVFQTAPINDTIIDRAINDRSVTDFEDAIQVACAVEAAADYIVSRNVDDFTDAALPAITADEFLAIFTS
jgi:predicted nucleic acid-binding protein